MREYSFNHKFETGLRPWPDNPRNSKDLEQCHNLKVYAGHLIVPTTMNKSVFSGYTFTNPQIMKGQERCFLGTDEHIHMLGMDMSVVSHLNVTTPTASWSIADFGSYAVFTNGAALYTLNPSTSNISAYSGSDIPVCRAICNFKGQLIAGSPTGYDPNVVLWGDIGRATMTLTDTVVAGYRPMFWPGYVYAVQQLGEYVAVYGQDGVALMATIDTVPPGFGMKEVSSQGLISDTAVAGSTYQHLYVRSDGMLCMMQVDPLQSKAFKHTELGYQSFFSGKSNVYVSYDDLLNEWYIADATTCYIYTTGGLSSTSNIVTGCAAFRGALYGLYTVVGSTSHYVQLCEADFGARADKAIEYLELASDGSWTTTIDWRRSTTDSFASSPTFPINPMGAGRAKVSGVDFKIKLSSTSANAQLDYLTCRWKYQDKRFVRGLDATTRSTRAS